MDDSATPGSFCFRSSARLPCRDAELSAGPVYDAWPSLAPPGDLRFARTNPLIRAYFAPAGYEPLKQFRWERQHGRWEPRKGASFLTWVVHLHELGHLHYLDWTPAKDLAKVFLTNCYADIAELVLFDALSDCRIRAVAGSLDRWTARLGQIETSISFTEEVAVTALSLHAAAAATHAGGRWEGGGDEVAQVRELFLADARVRAACHAMEPLIGWLYGRPERATVLVPLLQPINSEIGSDETPSALDASARLRQIIAAWNTAGSEEAFERWLGELAKDEEIGQFLAIALQFANMRIPLSLNGGRGDYASACAEMLWRVTRGGVSTIPDHEDDQSFAGAFRSGVEAALAMRDEVGRANTLGTGGVVLLQPRLHRGRPVIGRSWLGEHRGAMAADIASTHVLLMFFEGLRQQLFERVGFACPNNVVGTRRCKCTPTVRRAMERLTDAARDGAFGPGMWTALACHR